MPPYLEDAEAWALLKVVGAGTVGLALFIWHHGVYPDFWTSLLLASGLDFISVLLTPVYWRK